MPIGNKLNPFNGILQKIFTVKDFSDGSVPFISSKDLTEDTTNLVFNAATDILTVGGGLVIGAGSAGIDYTLTFNGETNDGVITWMEDENLFKVSNDVLLPDNEKVFLGTGSDASISYDATNLVVDPAEVGSGVLNLKTTNPTFRLEETTGSYYALIEKVNSSQEFSISNYLSNTNQETGVITKYNNVTPSVSDSSSTDGRIPLGTSGTGDDDQMNTKAVVWDSVDELWKCWYAATDGSNYRIYMATAPDGPGPLVWTKENNTAASNSDGTQDGDGRVGLGTSGKGDDVNVINPGVLIDDDGTFLMWYLGYDGSSYRGYFATSSDRGYTWVKTNNVAASNSDTTSSDGRIPLGTAGKGDANHIISFAPIKVGSTYYIFYSGQDGGGVHSRIYLATTTDLDTMTKVNNTIPANSDGIQAGSGRVGLGTSGTGDDNYMHLGSVAYDGSKYRIFYVGHDGSASKSTYSGTSSDLLTWTKVNNSVPSASNTTSTDWRIPLGTSGKGDDAGVSSPEAVIKDGTYHIMYNGHNGAANRSYYATADALSVSNTEVKFLTSTTSDGDEDGIHTFGNSSGRIVINGDTIRFNISGSEIGQIDENSDWLLSGSVQLNDSEKLLLGTGSDASIYYDGSNLIIDPQEVGSGGVIIGSGAAGVDYQLTFDGETNDGVLSWQEDEDMFLFSDDILLNTTERVYFRDTGLSIHSSVDGQLDITADASLMLDAPQVVVGGPGTKHDGYVVRDPAEVQTTDDTPTAVDSITLLDENTYMVEAYVVGVESDGSNRASYHISCTAYRTSAGSATIQGTVTSLHSQESDASWDATFTVSSNDLQVSVTGVAATTIEWGCTLRYINMSN